VTGVQTCALPICSFPFSDSDKQWYIWGFYRINKNFYLGIRERASRLETLNTLSTVFFGIGLAGIILTIIAGWFIAQAIAKPVEKLIAYSKSIGLGNFNSQAPKNVNGEFAILKNSMAQMQTNLHEQNKEREQMLAQIAHEIRNPLGGIELLTGLIKEDLENDNPSQKHLNKISEEVYGLKNQLNLFLDYSKPINAEKSSVKLPEILNEIKGNLFKEIHAKNIAFNLKLANEKLQFDTNHLKQILTNLIANSIDAVDENGTITASFFKKNKTLIITVIDNGTGIKEENIAHIFRPFFTTKANGTGLGLAICKKLCEANKATINVEIKNNNTCFTIKIIS